MTAVERLARAYEAAWNAADMTALAGLNTPEVHWVNVVGMHWQGFDDVAKAHEIFCRSMFKDAPIRLEAIESDVALPGGARVAVIRWAMAAFAAPDGRAFPATRSRMTLVLVPRGDDLAIAHGANINIDPLAEPHDPMRRS